MSFELTNVKVTLSFVTPLGCDASPSKFLPRSFIRPPWQLSVACLYSWMERGTQLVKRLAQEWNT